MKGKKKGKTAELNQSRIKFLPKYDVYHSHAPFGIPKTILKYELNTPAHYSDYTVSNKQEKTCAEKHIRTYQIA